MEGLATMEKIIKHEEKIQSGAAIIKDLNNEVIKDNNLIKGQNFVNEQYEHSSKIKENNYNGSHSSHSEKFQLNNSRYENSDTNNKQYKENHETKRNKNTDYQYTRSTQNNRGEKIIVSTGTAASMIKEKASAKETIKSSNHRNQGHISMIKNEPSENIINDKLKGIISQNQPSGTTERKESYNQSKIVPRYKRNLNMNIEDVLHSTDDNTGNETAKQSIYQVVRTPKNAIRTYRTGRKILSAGRYTIKSAGALAIGRTTLGNVLKNRKNEIYKASTGLTTTAKDTIINFKGSTSEDIGIQTVVKTKNAIVTSSRTAKQTFRTGKAAAKLTKKTVKTTIKAGKKAAIAAQRTAFVVKTVAKFLMNPLVLKALIIIAAVTVILIAAVAAVSSVISFFSFLTFTSDKNDLNETHKYITELDTEILLEINEVESKWSKDKYHYYIDYGTPTAVNPDNIIINTDSTKLISYLTSKYDDFKYSDIKNELKTIHSQLYKINYREWDKEVDDDRTFIDPITGEEITIEGTKTVEHLDTTLEGISFEEWLTVYGNLDDSQKERYENTLISGGTTMLRSYGSPFNKTDWRPLISSRFGYRIDPVYGGKAFHNGIDISFPTGTEINSVSEGTASVGYDADGYGKYVTITYIYNNNTEISFTYGHCNEILVTDGQTVKKGDVIARVGSTGKSTGSHLHLTYKIDGKEYNPEFYLE